MTKSQIKALMEKARAATPGVHVEIYVEDEAIYLRWENPFYKQSERIAMFLWPGHPIEATEQVEKWFENSAKLFSESSVTILDLCERLLEMQVALEKIEEQEKPNSDNDPLGMGIVNQSYRDAHQALEKFGVKE